MTNWRIWLGLLLQTAGFLLREHAHALQRQDIISEVARRVASKDFSKPPACVFDCSNRFSGDAAFLGSIAIFLIIGGAILMITSRRASA